MNRRYSAEEYYEKCRILRKYFDNPALTTDVITGFPGETEEEFEESRRFVDKVDFYETHIFKYSKRRGTKAAEMKGQITEQEKAGRSAILQEMNERKQAEYEKQWVGKEVEVLFEGVTEKEGRKMAMDVGINVVDGKLCGDVDYSKAEDIISAATPVPGGVGTVTTSILLKNTVMSAIKHTNR